MEPGTPFSREQEYWIASYLDARLKGTRHPNADHPDRALLPQKLKPSGTGDDLLATSDDGKDSEWRSVSDLGVATAASVTTVQTNLDNHIADTSDAHDASAISILDTAGDFTATNVEDALAELQTFDEAMVSTYLALDASNGPVTGDLAIGDGARTKLGSYDATYGMLAVEANFDISNYALLYSASNTYINAKTAGSVYTRINNATVLQVAASAVTCSQPLAMSSQKITGLAAGTANGDAVRYEQAVKNEIVDAKGDLIVGTAADTVARLAVGTNGKVPFANSGDTAGVGWAYAAGTARSSFNDLSPGIFPTFDPMHASTTFSLTDGQVVFAAVYLPYDVTLTGAGFVQVVQGNTTQDNNNKIGLYTSDGTTLTRVAASADNGILWENAAGTGKTQSFSSTYDAQAGLYFIAMLANWSAVVTTPTIAASPALAHANISGLGTTGSALYYGTLAGQTDLDATEAWAGVVVTTAQPFLFLY